MTGRMRPVIQDRAGLDVQINVSGPSINCQLSGSLATPLGHYMVLGTANSVIADPTTMADMGMGMGGEMGMAPGAGMYAGRGFGGEGAMMGRGGYAAPAGPAGRGGPVDPATGLPDAEGAVEQPAKPKYNTSRFAFVVQVIEGESFPAEE
jgi:hypothetical protein